MHIKNIQQQRASKHFKNNFGIRNQARRCSCACCSCYNFPALVTTCNGLDTHIHRTHTTPLDCVQRTAVALSEKLCKPQNESEIENEIEEDVRPEI